MWLKNKTILCSFWLRQLQILLALATSYISGQKRNTPLLLLDAPASRNTGKGALATHATVYKSSV
jgi:hypothetical protein